MTLSKTYPKLVQKWKSYTIQKKKVRPQLNLASFSHSNNKNQVEKPKKKNHIAIRMQCYTNHAAKKVTRQDEEKMQNLPKPVVFSKTKLLLRLLHLVDLPLA